MLLGYKSFNEGLINKYGFKFELGKVYVANGEIIAGVNGNGFHMCRDMEDTFRYFDDESFDVCLVRGSGRFDYKYNEYYDYEMYAFEKIELLKKLTRSDIIEYGLNLRYNRFIKYISTIKLNAEEIKMFEERFANSYFARCHIAYYQKGEYDAYVKKRGSIL